MTGMNSLTPEKLSSLFGNAERNYVDCAFPKFECSFRTVLNETLVNMGMQTAFDPSQADFSGLADGGVFLQEVAQNAKIIVDEEGTKAAAVTSAVPGYEGLDPDGECKITVDRPFIYMIVDTATNLPIFTGVLADPAQE